MMVDGLRNQLPPQHKRNVQSRLIVRLAITLAAFHRAYEKVEQNANTG